MIGIQRLLMNTIISSIQQSCTDRCGSVGFLEDRHVSKSVAHIQEAPYATDIIKYYLVSFESRFYPHWLQKLERTLSFWKVKMSIGWFDFPWNMMRSCTSATEYRAAGFIKTILRRMILLQMKTSSTNLYAFIMLWLLSVKESELLCTTHQLNVARQVGQVKYIRPIMCPITRTNKKLGNHSAFAYRSTSQHHIVIPTKFVFNFFYNIYTTTDKSRYFLCFKLLWIYRYKR